MSKKLKEGFFFAATDSPAEQNLRQKDPGIFILVFCVAVEETMSYFKKTQSSIRSIV